MKSLTINWMLVATLLLTSCESFLIIKPAPQLMQSGNVFTTRQTAESAVDGIYAYIRASSPSFLNGIPSIYCGLASDELKVSAASELFSPFYENALQSDNRVISGQVWDIAYQTIYRCNAILEQLGNSVALSVETRNTLTGEMKMVRALHYFYLIGLFGDVPHVLSTEYSRNATLGRSPVAEIWAQIITDLEDAKRLLPESYRGGGKTRPNKWTAASLLSRVYLYAGEYTDAEAVSSSVISSGVYQLEPNVLSVFTINNSETIWEIAPPNNFGNTSEAAVFLPPNSGVLPPVLLYPEFESLFHTFDARRAWIGGGAIENGQGVMHPYKYRQLQYDPVGEYLVVLRLAEQYLIRAEARIHMSDMKGARTDINTLMMRAGIDTLTTVDDNLLMEILREERRKELFSEWGHRWFDLGRWGIRDDVLRQLKPGWTTTSSLFPIPQEQLLYNPNMIQNPGY